MTKKQMLLTLASDDFNFFDDLVIREGSFTGIVFKKHATDVIASGRVDNYPYCLTITTKTQDFCNVCVPKKLYDKLSIGDKVKLHYFDSYRYPCGIRNHIIFADSADMIGHIDLSRYGWSWL